LGIGDWAQSPIPNPQSPKELKYKIYKLDLNSHFKNLIYLVILIIKIKLFDLLSLLKLLLQRLAK